MASKAAMVAKPCVVKNEPLPLSISLSHRQPLGRRGMNYTKRT
jgi:hypothetical protein